MAEDRKFMIERILAESVDEGLKILGDSGKQAILFYLEKNFSVKKSDIPKNPAAFAEGLKNIFGEGAYVIQKVILQNFYSKLGLIYEEKKDYTFIDYLREVKHYTKH
jgi:hypothetical protein